MTNTYLYIWRTQNSHVNFFDALTNMAQNCIATTRCTNKLSRDNSTSSPTLNKQGHITVSAFTGGMEHQRTSLSLSVSMQSMWWSVVGVERGHIVR